MTVRRPRPWLLGLLAVVLVSAGWTAWRMTVTRGHLEDARTDLGRAKDALYAADFDGATAALRRATAEAAAARDSSSDPVTAAWSHVPLLGGSVSAARRVASGSDELASQVLQPTVATVTKLSSTGLRRPDGSIVVTALPAAAADLSGPQQRAAAIAKGLRHHGLLVLPAVAHAQDELQARARELSAALATSRQALDAAPDFLGAARPKRWFVLVQQPGESRGTGGLPGGFAVLEARNGKLTAVRQGSNLDLQPATFPPPANVPKDFVLRYQDDGMFSMWQNVNLSPDLPMVARVVEDRWQRQFHQHIDGVIALDPSALVTLLAGSPPLRIGGQTVDVAHLDSYLALGQYADPPGGSTDQIKRKDALTAVAQQVVSRLTGGAGNNTSLFGGVLRAARSGHLRFATDDPALRPLLASTGVDGSLPRGPAPVAYAVLNNGSGGKLDYFLRRSISYSGDGCDGRRRRTTITVSLRSVAPPVGDLPRYVTINLATDPSSHSSTGTDVLSVYGTRGARLVSATLDGAPLRASGVASDPVDVGEEAGLPVWRVRLDTPPSKTRTLVLHVDEPVVAGAPRVPLQPLSDAPARSVTLPTC